MSPTHLPLPRFTRNDLRGDCGQCFALCCTAFGFSRSTDFAADKAPGTPCRHLGVDFECGIHDSLPARGYRGCVTFDCFGAGQVVSQRLSGGISWRERPDSARSMFAAFAIVKQLHEMLWYLFEAQERSYDADAIDSARALATTITEHTSGDLRALSSIDLERLHGAVRAVLGEISEQVRASYFAEPDVADARLRAGADLAGVDLRSGCLCGSDLRGACLIGVDLRGTDLAGVDLLGADLRDARLGGADLSAALYVTQSQVDAACGDHRTRLPAAIATPSQW